MPDNTLELLIKLGYVGQDQAQAARAALAAVSQEATGAAAATVKLAAAEGDAAKGAEELQAATEPLSKSLKADPADSADAERQTAASLEPENPEGKFSRNKPEPDGLAIAEQSVRQAQAALAETETHEAKLKLARDNQLQALNSNKEAYERLNAEIVRQTEMLRAHHDRDTQIRDIHQRLDADGYGS